MTDNEIIQALKCLCGDEILCKNCAYKSDTFACKKMASIDVLDLIRRKQSEIKRLNCAINEIKDLVKGLRIGFDNEMEYVFDETLEKINEITDECCEEVKE